MALSDMIATKRYFTVEEANRMLPLIRQIVGDIVEQFRLVSQLKDRIDPILQRTSKKREKDPYLEELAHTKQELDAEQAKLTEYIEELMKLGVELKGADGLCDFPSQHEGRDIYLCWRLGETQVQHWHELDAGFSGRMPLESLASNPDVN